MKLQHAQLIKAMIAYDSGDALRIQHFLKVHSFAVTIARLEGLDEESIFILEAAAILHDIGIHISEIKYGNCAGKHQEEEGPAEAEKLLHAIGGYSVHQIERICYLIAHHHTNVDGMDYQILLEADFLVNAFEDNLNIESILNFERRVFKTNSGKFLLETMFHV